MYMSLHGILVQLQVLFRGSLLHELRAQLINLVSAAGHSVCHHLRAALLLLELQLHALQLILAETRKRATLYNVLKRRLWVHHISISCISCQLAFTAIQTLNGDFCMPLCSHPWLLKG